MTWDHAVVVVAGRDERRRISDTGPDVVERRVRVQGPELITFVRGSVIAGPCPADRELVEPEHVHHADFGECGAEELRMLRHRRADEQSSIRAAADPDALR